nr:MAG TPA: hypothetical protein [Caudoviricetes sp.]
MISILIFNIETGSFTHLSINRSLLTPCGILIYKVHIVPCFSKNTIFR